MDCETCPTAIIMKGVINDCNETIRKMAKDIKKQNLKIACLMADAAQTKLNLDN